MALAETAQLVVDLRLNDQLSGGVSRAEAQLAGLGRTTSGSVGATGMLGGAFGKLGVAAEGVGGALSHAGNQLKGLVTGPAGIIAMTGGTLALGAALKDTVTSAMDFQKSMELIATQAGGTQAEVDAMTKGILAMSTSVGTSPDLLAAGLYHIESAGLRGAQALDILKIAAEGAKVGNADLESVTNAMIASVTSGIGGVSDMGQAMGTLNAIVGAGNMRMQDLTDAFGTGILSTAKTFGVSLQSVGAAIADMTNQGVPAIDAATRLRMSMSLLAAPTSKAAKLFESVGLSQLTLAGDMRGPGGIMAAVQDLATHMQKAGLIDSNGQPNARGADFLSQAFGGGRSSSAIMTLIGSLGKLSDIQKQINDGAGNFGDAWAKTTQEAEFSFAKFQAAVGVLAIRLGNALLPTLSSIASAAGDWLGDPANQQSLVGGLTSAIDLAKELGSGIKDFILPPLKMVADAIGLIPGPIKEAALALFVLNKSAGWLFGTSPLKVATNTLGSIIGPLLGRVPVIGGAVSGAMGVPHVWVDNMPIGGIGGGGGIGGAAEAAAGAAAGGTALGLATLGAGIGGILAAYALPYLFPGQAAQPATVASGAAAGTVLPATGYMSIDALSQGNPALKNFITENTRAVGDLGRDMDKNIGATANEIHASRDDAALNARALAAEARNQKDAINRAANNARDDVRKQLAGQLDAKKAVQDGDRILAVYTSGTATNTQWVKRNIETLTALQDRFKRAAAEAAAKGDIVTANANAATAAALGADITTLQSVLHGDLQTTIGAINAWNPSSSGKTNEGPWYIPAPTPSSGGGSAPTSSTSTGRGPAPRARAGGGRAEEGTPYWVGERQPELFVPDVSGTILPSALAAQQFRDRLTQLSSDQNANAIRIAAAASSRPSPQVSVIVNSTLGVSDINRGQHVTIAHGGGVTNYGNRPVGVGPGVN